MLGWSFRFLALALVALITCSQAVGAVADPPPDHRHAHVDAVGAPPCSPCVVDLAHHGMKAMSLAASDGTGQWADALALLAEADPALSTPAPDDRFSTSIAAADTCRELWRRPACGRKAKPSERAPPGREGSAPT